MKFSKLCLLGAILFCTNALAQNIDPIVEDAAARFDNDFLESWAFTETRTSSDGVRIAQYDPTRGEGNDWQLISVNGEQPDQGAITEFLEEKAARKAEREEDDNSDDLLKMISPESLELVEDSADGWRYSFQPQDEDDEGFMQHVQGELYVSKQGQYLETIGMNSRGAFKPRTGVKIKEFSMQMQFGPATDSGPIVPLKITTQVVGKAFLVANFNENVVVEFSEYMQVK